MDQPLIVKMITDLRSARAVLAVLKETHPRLLKIWVPVRTYSKLVEELLGAPNGPYYIKNGFTLVIDNYTVYLEPPQG